ncbi:hypothetical protein LZ30DRAFT_78247 [Colletotrichum cereale]|nr:hypothetical protein LZ30DRAFT_78247 [Colletotrichum cereale]
MPLWQWIFSIPSQRVGDLNPPSTGGCSCEDPKAPTSRSLSGRGRLCAGSVFHLMWLKSPTHPFCGVSRFFRLFPPSVEGTREEGRGVLVYQRQRYNWRGDFLSPSIIASHLTSNKLNCNNQSLLIVCWMPQRPVSRPSPVDGLKPRLRVSIVP